MVSCAIKHPDNKDGLIKLKSVTTAAQNNNQSDDPVYIDGDSWHSVDDPASVTIDGNIWDDMQDYLMLPDYSSRKDVAAQIHWYKEHQSYLNRIIKHAAPYLYYIFQQTKKKNLPAELSLLPIIESEYNPFEYSKVGAVGLWQMMPGTASGLGLKIDWWYDGRRDIIASTNVALDYLTYLNDFFTHNWLLAIAAYDSGNGTVQRAIEHNKHLGLPTSFWDLKLPHETKSYLPKLLALSAIVRDPSAYGINLQPVNDAPYLAKVDIDSQINLDQAAKLASIPVKTLRTLNPGFRRWATDPNGPFYLLMPVNHANTFKKNLIDLPKSKRVTWQRHTVQSGETLISIAHKYHTNSNTIKLVNHLSSSIIHTKQQLLIPNKVQAGFLTEMHALRASVAENRIPGPHRVECMVNPGDTLWTVAKRYNVSVREICFWNNLNKHKNVKPGKKLLIWAPTYTYKIAIPYVYHTVKSGDSLSTIAHKFGSTVTKIKSANNLKNNLLHLGQKLKVPVKNHYKYVKTYHHGKPLQHFYYQVQTGDTLSTIADRFDVTSKDLKRWNHIKKYIHPKQSLVIYKHNMIIHTVRKGELLGTIALTYHVSVNKLKQWNKLQNSQIFPGQKLYIFRK